MFGILLLAAGVILVLFRGLPVPRGLRVFLALPALQGLLVLPVPPALPDLPDRKVSRV